MKTQIQFFNPATGKKNGKETLNPGGNTLKNLETLGLIYIVNVIDFTGSGPFSSVIVSGVLDLYRERGKTVIPGGIQRSEGDNQRYMPVFEGEIGFVNTGNQNNPVVVARVVNIFTRDEKKRMQKK